jgi:hypothetical protein
LLCTGSLCTTKEMFLTYPASAQPFLPLHTILPRLHPSCLSDIITLAQILTISDDSSIATDLIQFQDTFLHIIHKMSAITIVWHKMAHVYVHPVGLQEHTIYSGPASACFGRQAIKNVATFLGTSHFADNRARGGHGNSVLVKAGLFVRL